MEVGEAIALMGLMIATQALLQWLYLRSNEKLVRTYNEKFDQVLKNKNLLRNNQTNFMETVNHISSILQMHDSLVTRLLHETNSPIRGKVGKEIQQYNFLLDKSIHEINLFSTDEIEFHSAVKALSEEYGDLESLQLMIKCNLDIYEGKNSQLLKGIYVLQQKIDPNYRRHMWL